MTTPYSDLRLDSGLDASDTTTFSDAALDTIWERVSGASTDAKRHSAALGLMAWQMMTKFASLHDQSVVQSSSKQSQIYEHWKEIYSEHKKDLGAAINGGNTQLVRSGIRLIPREVDEPNA
jgi:hypothetical protein